MLNRDYMSEMSKCNTGISLHTTQYYSNFVASNYNTILKIMSLFYIWRSREPIPA